MLEDLIGRKLLEREAGNRQISVGELADLEIEKKITTVTSEETKAIYEKEKARYSGMSEPETFRQIESRLRHQRLNERFARLIDEELERARVLQHVSRGSPTR